MRPWLFLFLCCARVVTPIGQEVVTQPLPQERVHVFVLGTTGWSNHSGCPQCVDTHNQHELPQRSSSALDRRTVCGLFSFQTRHTSDSEMSNKFGWLNVSSGNFTQDSKISAVPQDPCPAIPWPWISRMAPTRNWTGLALRAVFPMNFRRARCANLLRSTGGRGIGASTHDPCGIVAILQLHTKQKRSQCWGRQDTRSSLQNQPRCLEILVFGTNELGTFRPSGVACRRLHFILGVIALPRALVGGAVPLWSMLAWDAYAIETEMSYGTGYVPLQYLSETISALLPYRRGRCKRSLISCSSYRCCWLGHMTLLTRLRLTSPIGNWTCSSYGGSTSLKTSSKSLFSPPGHPDWGDCVPGNSCFDCRGYCSGAATPEHFDCFCLNLRVTWHDPRRLSSLRKEVEKGVLSLRSMGPCWCVSISRLRFFCLKLEVASLKFRVLASLRPWQPKEKAGTMVDTLFKRRATGATTARWCPRLQSRALPVPTSGHCRGALATLVQTGATLYMFSRRTPVGNARSDTKCSHPLLVPSYAPSVNSCMHLAVWTRTSLVSNAERQAAVSAELRALPNAASYVALLHIRQCAPEQKWGSSPPGIWIDAYAQILLWSKSLMWHPFRNRRLTRPSLLPTKIVVRTERPCRRSRLSRETGPKFKPHPSMTDAERICRSPRPVLRDVSTRRGLAPAQPSSEAQPFSLWPVRLYLNLSAYKNRVCALEKLRSSRGRLMGCHSTLRLLIHLCMTYISAAGLACPLNCSAAGVFEYLTGVFSSRLFLLPFCRVLAMKHLLFPEEHDVESTTCSTGDSTPFCESSIGSFFRTSHDSDLVAVYLSGNITSAVTRVLSAERYPLALGEELERPLQLSWAKGAYVLISAQCDRRRDLFSLLIKRSKDHWNRSVFAGTMLFTQSGTARAVWEGCYLLGDLGCPFEFSEVFQLLTAEGAFTRLPPPGSLAPTPEEHLSWRALDFPLKIQTPWSSQENFDPPASSQLSAPMIVEPACSLPRRAAAHAPSLKSRLSPDTGAGALLRNLFRQQDTFGLVFTRRGMTRTSLHMNAHPFDSSVNSLERPLGSKYYLESGPPRCTYNEPSESHLHVHACESLVSLSAIFPESGCFMAPLVHSDEQYPYLSRSVPRPGIWHMGAHAPVASLLKTSPLLFPQESLPLFGQLWQGAPSCSPAHNGLGSFHQIRLLPKRKRILPSSNGLNSSLDCDGVRWTVVSDPSSASMRPCKKSGGGAQLSREPESLFNWWGTTWTIWLSFHSWTTIPLKARRSFVNPRVRVLWISSGPCSLTRTYDALRCGTPRSRQTWSFCTLMGQLCASTRTVRRRLTASGAHRTSGISRSFTKHCQRLSERGSSNILVLKGRRSRCRLSVAPHTSLTVCRNRSFFACPAFLSVSQGVHIVVHLLGLGQLCGLKLCSFWPSARPWRLQGVMQGAGRDDFCATGGTPCCCNWTHSSATPNTRPACSRNCIEPSWNSSDYTDNTQTMTHLSHRQRRWVAHLLMLSGRKLASISVGGTVHQFLMRVRKFAFPRIQACIFLAHKDLCPAAIKIFWHGWESSALAYWYGSAEMVDLLESPVPAQPESQQIVGCWSSTERYRSLSASRCAVSSQ